MKQQGKISNSRKYLFFGAMAAFICLAAFGVAAWTAVNHPAFASIVPRSTAPAPVQEEILWAQVEISKPLASSFDVSSFAPQTVDTPAPTVDLSEEPDLPPTDVPTEELSALPEPTETPAQLAMEIVPPTPTSAYIPPADPQKPSSVNVGNGVRWIDVDLTHQRVYAYEGDVIVNSFTVSTGTWATPTVTGQYKVYVKYRSAKMSGPGYYLPNVPYIMYFYKGYGLHGTYWHNNFGTPMSHGCVNLRTEDAEWLFNWASVGTLVNVRY
jgi:lipoprotein-anchoring transpeptidase ErfK/SrfK